jgi:hypothetical protein
MLGIPSKDDLIRMWNVAAESGELLIPKHNPASLGTVFAQFRTVLSHDMDQNLMTFINSRNYVIRCYQDHDPYHGDIYCEIIPSDPRYSVPASGVPARSPVATTVCDRITAVSGADRGWHMFGENSTIIESKVAAGELSIICEYDW